jgi:uncharacterized protein (TIGR04255 family)
VRIGDSVLSLHVLPKYCGWAVWQKEIGEAVGFLFSKLPGINIIRIGLRYVNALVPDRHLISGLTDLNLSILLAGTPVSERANLNVGERNGDVEILTRIATKGFVQGNVPTKAAVIVDVDVSSREEFPMPTPGAVMNWIEVATTSPTTPTAFFFMAPPPSWLCR